jgi:DNA-binding beta-propeller fold protein YncE
MSRRRPFPPALLAVLLLAAVPAHAVSTKGFVLTTDYATGTLSVVDLAARTVTSDVAMVSPDPVARWHDGLLYVVNRLGYDNVQVIDPANGYATVRQFSVGSGTNPQDIAFASASKAYVSRLGSPDLLVVDPGTGVPSGSISLAAWADADGNPEAARMTMVGDLLFVALERLTNFAPADTGLVVVIDTHADTVFDADPFTAGVQVVRLPGKNPRTDFALLPGGAPMADSRLFIGCTGHWGLLDGGIAEIVVPGWAHGQPAAITCAGYAITEGVLGGDAVDVVAYGAAHSYAIVSDASYNTSLVAWDPEAGTKLTTLYATGGYCLTDIALDDRRELYVCNSSFETPGLHVFAAGSDVRLAGPIATGLPPVQVVFDQAEGPVDVTEAPAPSGFALAPPAPNPARSSVRFAFTLAEPGSARVEVFDPAGRRVRVLEGGDHPAGTTSLAWDLRDAGGRRVRPGVYLVRGHAAGTTVDRRLVVLD